MPKFLQSGALFALTLALAPLAARADEVMFRGQKIEYGGASEVKLIGRELSFDQLEFGFFKSCYHSMRFRAGPRNASVGPCRRDVENNFSIGRSHGSSRGK